MRLATFPQEVWEWLDVLGDALLVTQAEAVLHEGFSKDTPYKDLLVRMINKDMSSLSAIYLLLRFECIHQAAAHVRLLCDALITMHFIALDPTVRTQQFLAYADIETFEIASALLQWESSRARPEHVARLGAFVASAELAYQKAKPQFTHTDARGKPRPFLNWCNKKISEQATACGGNAVRLYSVVFKQMSSYVHGSAWSLRRQIAYSKRHYKPEVVLNDVATIVRTALVVWIEWAKFCDSHLGWNLTADAVEIARRVDELDASHFPVPHEGGGGL
jgi:hypothetical protein